MDFKTFFVKKVMMAFFISVTCITVVMALIGILFEPDVRFGYEAFFSPLLFGTLGSLPMLVKYSKKELSVKQTLVRSALHCILLEIIILTTLNLAGLLTSIPMAISLGTSIVVITMTVNLVLWIQDTRTAKEFNDALKRLQGDYSAGE